MSDQAQTPNVFLDTEVFEQYNYDFTSPSLSQFCRLVRFAAVNPFLTSVTLGEIRRHINERAKRAFEQVQRSRREAAILKARNGPPLEGLFTWTEEEIRQAMHEEFDAFLEDCQVTVLQVDGVSPRSVFDDYFAERPPFGRKNKKREFPDAFAAAAIKLWCDQRLGQKIYVVSGDGDWKAVCENNSALVYRSCLAQLLEDFADTPLVQAIKKALAAQEDELADRLLDQFTDLNYEVTGGQYLPDFEVEHAQVEVCDMHVVEVKDGKAVVGLECEIDFTLSVDAVDEQTATHDPERNLTIYTGGRSGMYQSRIVMPATAFVKYDEKHPEQVTVEDVMFDCGFIPVDLTRIRFDEDKKEPDCQEKAV